MTVRELYAIGGKGNTMLSRLSPTQTHPLCPTRSHPLDHLSEGIYSVHVHFQRPQKFKVERNYFNESKMIGFGYSGWSAPNYQTEKI